VGDEGACGIRERCARIRSEMIPSILPNLCLDRAKPVSFFKYELHFLAVADDNTAPRVGTPELADEDGLAEPHRRLSGQGGGRYVEFCAFRADDAERFKALRLSEAGATASGGVD
jgi:hypothetical protein